MRLITIALLLTTLVNYSKAQCYKSGQNLPSGYTTISSGYPGLDAVIYSEIPKLQMFFGTKIDFFYLLEASGSNAFYHADCNHDCDGTIFLGIKLLHEEYNSDPSMTTVKAVLAHEFGHCLQRLQGWKESGKRPELHSDVMAGYYIRKTNPLLNEELFLRSINSFLAKGDFAFGSPTHHGTPQERACAFLYGWNLGCEPYNYSIEDASQRAIDYVVVDNPCGAIPTIRPDVEQKIILQRITTNHKYNYRTWKYGVTYINRQYHHSLSIGFSSSKITGLPWSLYYEKVDPNAKSTIRYNLQYRNHSDNPGLPSELNTRYWSLGVDLKKYITKNILGPSIYYSYSLQARSLRKEFTSESNKIEKSFFVVPAMRIGIEGATLWIEGGHADYPTTGDYDYWTTHLKHNRLVLSTDLGLGYYSPIHKLGLEYNLILSYRFN
jgi:hypothetical protein